ncbi:MAG: hypothetical protein JKY54_01690 [Flavobacteriales bacterium]|nr:hypothetical protein [Flavobacteriales bacterium]
MSNKLNNSEKRAKALLLTNFINLNQLSVIFKNEELQNQFDNIYEIISNTPKVYEQEEIESDKKKFYIHYFNPNSDFYISEKDFENEQLQAYGFACLNGDKQNAEFGYISINEIIKLGFEIDLHFQPCLQSTILEKF